jgi:hypothetical protein
MDVLSRGAQDDSMTTVIAPLPVHGHVLPDVRGDGRAVRVSWHPEVGAVVLSLWHDGRCTATARLAPDTVGQLVGVLVEGLAAAATAPRDAPAQASSA